MDDKLSELQHSIRSEQAFTADINHFLALAEISPIVRNGLLRKEHVIYCMGWGKILNPTSAPFTTVYNACGPDIVTAQLVTNSDNVIGIDPRPPKAERLQMYLERYDTVDDPTVSFPGEDLKYLNEDDSKENAFLYELNTRREKGYWNAGFMGNWSVERGIMIELKKMGVVKNSVRIFEADNRAGIRYTWAYPGDILRERSVLYMTDYTVNFLAQLSKTPMPINCFYEKSFPGARYRMADDVASDIVELKQYIAANGAVLIGCYTDSDENNLEEETVIRNSLGSEFSPLHIPQEYTGMMQQVHNDHPFSNSYGWQLYGARKL